MLIRPFAIGAAITQSSLGVRRWVNRLPFANLAQQVKDLLAGQVGFWYDVQDLSSMRKNSAEPASVGQPVAYLFDKSQGMAGLVLRQLSDVADFPSRNDGYQATVQKVDGVLALRNTRNDDTLIYAVANFSPFTVVATAVSKVYKMTYTSWCDEAASNYYIRVQQAQAPYSSFTSTVRTNRTPQTFTDYIIVSSTTATSLGLVFNVTAPNNTTICNAYFSDVTFEEVLGNHATMPTTAGQPILRQDVSGKYYLETDGVDDQMRTPAIPFTGSEVIVGSVTTANNVNTVGIVYETILDGTLQSANTAGCLARLYTASELLSRPNSSGTGTSVIKSVAGQNNIKHLAVAWSANNIANLKVNNVLGTTYTPVGTALLPNRLALFHRPTTTTTMHFAGKFYGAVAVNKPHNPADVELIQAYLADSTGVTL